MLVLKLDKVAAVRDLLLELLDLEVGDGALRLPRVLDLHGVARVHELADGVLQIVAKLRWAVGDAAPGALEWATLCERAVTIEGEELGKGLVANCLNLPRDD